MEETKTGLNWVRILITIVIVLVAAGAVGGTTYYVLNSNFQKEREANEKALSDLQTQVKNQVPKEKTETATKATTEVDSLTKEMIKNATYTVSGKTFKLNNGVYESGETRATIKDTENWIIVNNNLGISIVNLNTGGTGFFYSLVSFKVEDGIAKQVSAISLGDRPIVRSVALNNSKVTVGLTVAGPNDPSCCPSQAVTKNYQLSPAGTLSEL